MPYAGASVDADTKERWEEYIEQSDYGSMSELVRGAVRQEIRSEEGSAAGSSREQTMEVERLQEQQQATLDKLEELRNAVEEAQEERETTEYPEEVVELAHRIAGDLNTIPSEEYRRMEEEATEELAQIAVEHLGEATDTHKVKAALNYLEENVPWIRRKPSPASDYYRVED